MKILPSSMLEMKEKLWDTIKRFPATFIVIIFATTIGLTLANHIFWYKFDEPIAKLLLTSFIAYALSVSAYLFAEWNWKERQLWTILQIPVLLFSIWFYFWLGAELGNFENFVFFTMTLIWIIASLFFSPYIKNLFKPEYKENSFYTYFYSIATVFLISTILGIILVILWAIWIFAVETLFDIWISDDTLLNWIVLATIFITPSFALNKVPSKESFSESYFNENMFFSFLIKYIALPFVYLYFIILYTYSIKVLLDFSNWPHWEVSWMVIWFSIFGYLTYIFSYIFDNKSNFISKTRAYFPFVVIPQIFMLFYAIYLRIAQYDLTVNRYFVVIFWVWLLLISVYYAISKEKRLHFVVSTLTLFTIIFSIWPWSVYSLPETRQYERLINNLEKANILVDWEIIPLKDYYDIDKKLSKEIYSWIEFVCKFSECEKIKELFKWHYDNNLEGSYSITYGIAESIKVKSYFKNDYLGRETIRLYKKYNWIYNEVPYDIAWYSYLVEINNYNYDNKYQGDKSRVAKIDWNKVYIKIPWEDIMVIDISEWLNKVWQISNNWTLTEFSEWGLSFEAKDSKIYLNNLTIKNPKLNPWENIKAKNASWYILIK